MEKEEKPKIKKRGKRKCHLRVPVFDEEKTAIEEKAQTAGLSVARYLRETGQGFHIKSVVDYEHVQELAKINGDLGRLGGLLKFWLTGDPRVGHFNQSTVRHLLKRIESTQDEMAGVMKSIVRPKAS